MKHVATISLRHWMVLLFIALLSAAVVVPEATAQRRSTTERSRAERSSERSRSAERSKARRSRTKKRAASRSRSRAARSSEARSRSSRSRSARSSKARSRSSRSRASRSSEARSRSSRSRSAQSRSSRSRASRSSEARSRSSRSRAARSERSRAARSRSARSSRSQARSERSRSARSRAARSRSNERGRSTRSRSGNARSEQARASRSRSRRAARTAARRDQRRGDVRRRSANRHRVEAKHRRYRDRRVRRHRPKYQRPVYRKRHKRYRRYCRDLIVQPRIDIDINWPWVHRHRTGWRPHYRYRQVVYVEVGWNRHRRRSRIDVRTDYYHQLRYATPRKAVVDIYLDRIELYENGRYLGEVLRIPDRLGHVRATIYRGGRVEFDRDVFLVGDAYEGFELISTRHYNDYLLDAYHRSHGFRVGVVDLRRKRVDPVQYSRFFDPVHFTGYAPISLLPEDRQWLFDYGRDSFSARYYEEDPYYYGGYYDDEYYEDEYYEYSEASGSASYQVQPLTNARRQTVSTSFGAQIQFRRESEFVRLE